MESSVMNQKLEWSSGNTITLGPGLTAGRCVMFPQPYGSCSWNTMQTQMLVLMRTMLLFRMWHCQNIITILTPYARRLNKPSLTSSGTAECIGRLCTSDSPSRTSSLAWMLISMNMSAKIPTPGKKLAASTFTSSSETARYSTWIWERVFANLTQRMPQS